MIAAITLDSLPVTLGGLAVGFEVEGLVSPAGIGLSAIVWRSAERTLYLTSPIREGGQMAVLGICDKQPREIIDIVVSYADALAGREATSIVPNIETPAGMTLAGTDIGPDSVRLYVAGGTSGQTYQWTVLTDIVVGGKTLRLEDEFIAAVQEAY